jgi:uncharacterized protein (TIGR03118 family)
MLSRLTPGRTAQRRRHAYRPRLEGLEQRCLLASYSQTNLVADTPGVAQFTDPHLVNAWGMSYAPGGPFWVSDNGTGLSTLYNGVGQIQSLVVTIPPPAGSNATAAPTGTVYNATSGFKVTENNLTGPSAFLFDTEDGTISGWAPSVDATNAVLAVDHSMGGTGAVYKGLAIATTSSGTFLYAANFRAATVEAYDQNFQAAHLQGTFSDPNLPAGYAPFDIQSIGGLLYVTYAKQDAAKHDDVPGPGHGFVDIFTTQGVLVHRFISHTHLNSPWGIVKAPANFGTFSGDILVGNFGDGKINAFNPKTGAFVGTVSDSTGNAIVIDGLWGLKFGGGGQGGPTNWLYFTAGPSGETHGLFGYLIAGPVGQPAVVGHVAQTFAGTAASPALHTIQSGVGIGSQDTAQETGRSFQSMGIFLGGASASEESHASLVVDAGHGQAGSAEHALRLLDGVFASHSGFAEDLSSTNG